MQTASEQALEDSSKRKKNKSRRRRGVNPMVVAIAALLMALSLVVMGVYLLKIWPPKLPEANLTVREHWDQSRSATPGIQHANGLTVEKIGAPQHSDGVVTVILKVTNNVMMPDPNAPTPEAETDQKVEGPLVPANVYNGTIRVLFFNEKDGEQHIVGGGYGNVVNLNHGESREITVVSTPVENYSEATQYEAFPDYVWTDKDPVKATPEAGATP